MSPSRPDARRMGAITCRPALAGRNQLARDAVPLAECCRRAVLLRSFRIRAGCFSSLPSQGTRNMVKMTSSMTFLRVPWLNFFSLPPPIVASGRDEKLGEFGSLAWWHNETSVRQNCNRGADGRQLHISLESPGGTHVAARNLSPLSPPKKARSTPTSRQRSTIAKVSCSRWQ